MSDQPDDRRGVPGFDTTGSDLRRTGGLGRIGRERPSNCKAAPRPRGSLPPGAPAAAPGYSPGISAQGQRVIFVSGQGPTDMKADMETQIRQTMDHIGLVLKAGGASWSNVVFVRSYFVDIASGLPIFRKVRRDYYQEPYPASTAVGVTALATPDRKVAIEAVAIV